MVLHIVKSINIKFMHISITYFANFFRIVHKKYNMHFYVNYDTVEKKCKTYNHFKKYILINIKYGFNNKTIR